LEGRGRTLPQKNKKGTGLWWLTPVTLATWKAEIGMIIIGGQPEQIVLQTPIFKTN
jgi:hypothetical protein